MADSIITKARAWLAAGGATLIGAVGFVLNYAWAEIKEEVEKEVDTAVTQALDVARAEWKEQVAQEREATQRERDQIQADLDRILDALLNQSGSD